MASKEASTSSTKHYFFFFSEQNTQKKKKKSSPVKVQLCDSQRNGVSVVSYQSDHARKEETAASGGCALREMVG